MMHIFTGDIQKSIIDLCQAFENKSYQSYKSDIHYNFVIQFVNLDVFDKAIQLLTSAIELQNMNLLIQMKEQSIIGQQIL
ncbi:unnamed protein product [Paramecium primaurelia]|uniref:Uncharacterized protein n=1 Tax=Paramecium primaurelia TaxID=5886 RepID=A0A8S1Q724_PARPR|nr:unnamed protein product [Paramecium primaurelia]